MVPAPIPPEAPSFHNSCSHMEICTSICPCFSSRSRDFPSPSPHTPPPKKKPPDPSGHTTPAPGASTVQLPLDPEGAGPQETVTSRNVFDVELGKLYETENTPSTGVADVEMDCGYVSPKSDFPVPYQDQEMPQSGKRGAEHLLYIGLSCHFQGPPGWLSKTQSVGNPLSVPVLPTRWVTRSRSFPNRFHGEGRSKGPAACRTFPALQQGHSLSLLVGSHALCHPEPRLLT